MEQLGKKTEPEFKYYPKQGMTVNSDVDLIESFSTGLKMIYTQSYSPTFISFEKLETNQRGRNKLISFAVDREKCFLLIKGFVESPYLFLYS